MRLSEFDDLRHAGVLQQSSLALLEQDKPQILPHTNTQPESKPKLVESKEKDGKLDLQAQDHHWSGEWRQLAEETGVFRSVAEEDGLTDISATTPMNTGKDRPSHCPAATHAPYEDGMMPGTNESGSPNRQPPSRLSKGNTLPGARHPRTAVSPADGGLGRRMVERPSWRGRPVSHTRRQRTLPFQDRPPVPRGPRRPPPAYIVDHSEGVKLPEREPALLGVNGIVGGYHRYPDRLGDSGLRGIPGSFT